MHSTAVSIQVCLFFMALQCRESDLTRYLEDPPPMNIHHILSRFLDGGCMKNLRIYSWISMTWADLAGRRHQPLQFFHTDMQTQLEVYNAAQRLLRTEPRTIQSVQTNIHSMQLDVNLICKCKRTDCFAISEILCYLGSSLSLSLIVHDH